MTFSWGCAVGEEAVKLDVGVAPQNWGFYAFCPLIFAPMNRAETTEDIRAMLFFSRAYLLIVEY